MKINNEFLNAINETNRYLNEARLERSKLLERKKSLKEEIKKLDELIQGFQNAITLWGIYV
jgi:cell division septum initiation protein DivIVA